MAERSGYQLPCALDASHTLKHGVLVQQLGFLQQHVTHFDYRSWVVLGDVGGDALAVGNRGGFP